MPCMYVSHGTMESALHHKFNLPLQPVQQVSTSSTGGREQMIGKWWIFNGRDRKYIV